MLWSARFLRPAIALALVLWLTNSLVALGSPSSFIPGGFVRDDDSVNTPPAQGNSPSLVLGSLAGDPANLVPWVAFAQPGSGSAQDIFVKTFDRASGQWVLRGASQNGGSLNLNRNVQAEHPSLDFAGPLVNGLRTVPWVAWYEPVHAFGDKNNIFASKFVQSSGQEFWQIAGQDRASGGLIPSLNIHTNQEAENPALAGGSANGSSLTAPWVAWEEDSAVTHKRQIFVSRAAAASGANIIGGFQWLPTGLVRIGADEPSINVDVNRDGVEPDIVFSGANNTVPWVVWYEQGGGRPARVFAAKASADASPGVLGGFRWAVQPDCASNEVTCALNRDASHDAVDPKIASGTLVGEDPSKPKPWIAWQETDGTHTQVFVSKFNGTTFVPVGGSLNVFQGDDAEAPDIFFVGHVPFVSFVEQIGSRKVLIVRHLANPSTGRWDLDTTLRGLNVRPAAPAALPSLGSDGSAPFVAWQEGKSQTNVFEAHRVPLGAAWGAVDPPVLAPAADQTLTLKISCDNAAGWQQINQIDLEVDSVSPTPGQTLLVRYTAPADPTRPASEGTLALFDPGSGSFSAPVQLGTATTLETADARLFVGQSTASGNGADAPAVDITLSLQLKAPAAQLSTTSLRIVNRDASDTGFFRIEGLSQVSIPLAAR